MTLADLVFIDPTGYHFASYPDFLSWLTDQYTSIYGSDVYLGADSQDGQFLSILAQAFYDTAALGASVYNSFSPISAQGSGLSRNVKINGIERKIASNSQADVTIIGQVGTVITNGVIQDTLNQLWNLPASVAIPSGGSITVTAVAQQLGAIAGPANTINKIFTPTLGWQSVNNPADATPGAPVETDAELRVRQQQSVADPSLTVFDGTIGGVENLTGVQKVRGYENATGTTDGNGIPGHSICLVVLGGDDMAIAQEIALHKTPGTGTFGNTSETVFDSHGMPLDIAFQRPTTATIGVQVTLTALSGWSSDFIPLIQQAVADQINSGQIGDTVFITKLFTPAYLTGTPAQSTFDIDTLLIQKNGGGFGGSNITLNFDENPVTDPSTDVVVIVT